MSDNLNKMIESLSSLSSDDLEDLKDEIDDEMRRRERGHFMELRENAIKALRDFFQASGYIVDNEENYSLGLDEDRLSCGDENCIYLR